MRNMVFVAWNSVQQVAFDDLTEHSDLGIDRRQDSSYTLVADAQKEDEMDDPSRQNSRNHAVAVLEPSGSQFVS